MVALLVFVLALGAVLSPAAEGAVAQAQPPAASVPATGALGEEGPAVVDMDAVVVSGVQPGPGLWRVRKDDHVLYILGTQSPLPRDMTWDAREVREVLAEAGAVLGPPGVSIGADVGFFRGLTLAPSALKAMKNPGGETLDELLPPGLYARWSGLKQRYMGRDRGVEKKRPLIAVYELYKEALDDSRLRQGGIVGPVITRSLKERGMKGTSTALELKIEDPREALADFRKEGLKPQDLECFGDTLDVIESDLPRIAARANAWAVGDLDALRAIPQNRSQVEACLSAWTETETARKRGLVDIDARVRDSWLQAVDKALSEHPMSFATMPIDNLLYDRDGYVAGLTARGYRIQAPDEYGEEAVDAAAGDALPPGDIAPAPAATTPLP
ncbi:polysaccharide biosynthesis protein GumN [Pseudoxanthomonas koreensis]|nr:polysaccharide biosynthesis protein GumN [Pseudoxanthomonas koreensis]